MAYGIKASSCDPLKTSRVQCFQCSNPTKPDYKHPDPGPPHQIRQTFIFSPDCKIFYTWHWPDGWPKFFEGCMGRFGYLRWSEVPCSLLLWQVYSTCVCLQPTTYDRYDFKWALTSIWFCSCACTPVHPLLWAHMCIRSTKLGLWANFTKHLVKCVLRHCQLEAKIAWKSCFSSNFIDF